MVPRSGVLHGIRLWIRCPSLQDGSCHRRLNRSSQAQAAHRLGVGRSRTGERHYLDRDARTADRQSTHAGLLKTCAETYERGLPGTPAGNRQRTRHGNISGPATRNFPPLERAKNGFPRPVSSVAFQIGRRVANLSRAARQDKSAAISKVHLRLYPASHFARSGKGTSKLVCMFDRWSVGCTVFGSPCLIHGLNFTATALQQTTL